MRFFFLFFFYLEGSRAKVHGDVEHSAEAGVQAQAEQRVDGQSFAEQLQRQDMPAAPGKHQRATEVDHLADRGQQRHQLKSFVSLSTPDVQLRRRHVFSCLGRNVVNFGL